jgi:hypothetical protein
MVVLTSLGWVGGVCGACAADTRPNASVAARRLSGMLCVIANI